jgi:hypothetical protein
MAAMTSSRLNRTVDPEAGMARVEGRGPSPVAVASGRGEGGVGWVPPRVCSRAERVASRSMGEGCLGVLGSAAARAGTSPKSFSMASRAEV